MSQPDAGYTLPVFACACAVAALRHLRGEIFSNPVSIDLINPLQLGEILIEQVAKIKENAALAISRSNPGDNLDLTRNTPVWAVVELNKTENRGDESIIIEGGEGVGRQVHQSGKAAIYRYAQKLLRENLQPLVQAGQQVVVTIILPEGKKLGERTSNTAFGVVEGLSLLGTSAISQPLSAPGQLAAYQKELAAKARQFEELVFCIGENGLDFARKMGVNPARLVKTANWLGPLLVAAGLQGIQEILLFGYHGKLLKLAGGIFHTHHHLADGRLEILTAHCAKVGLPTPILREILASPTAESALQRLRDLDRQEGTAWTDRVYSSIAAAIDRRTQDYIRQQGERQVRIGCLLFDRDRAIVAKSEEGASLLPHL